MQRRDVQKTVPGQETRDGAGVRLRRSLGTAALDHLDPFLLLDEFRSDRADDYVAGFPDHPHRGFETVTYMLAGSMQHRDHLGNQGDLGPGSVQWMTAGRGIIHSEMPRQQDGLLWGFQLWVNLPASDKMVPPRYQDIPAAEVPQLRSGDADIRLIAGEMEGTSGAVHGIATAPLYADVSLPAGAHWEQALPATHNAFLYVFEGQAEVKGRTQSTALESGSLGVLGPGEGVALATTSQAARLLVIAGHPLNEPVARHGPFVMNTRQELLQAVDDFQSGRF